VGGVLVWTTVGTTVEDMADGSFALMTGVSVSALSVTPRPAPILSVPVLSVFNLSVSLFSAGERAASLDSS
jgi:hypothetical protein